MDIQVAEGVGAYVHNIDLNTISTADADKLKKALGEYGVLFFRNQSLTEQNHIQFAEQFAPININRFFKAHADYPKIAEVLKEADQTGNIGSKWHTDHSYDQIPALGSILVARELPESGGDTIFASMFAAYDALDDAMKEDMKGRLGNTAAATQDAVHPIVISHPVSGKRGIYVNPDFTTHILDLSAEESESLLNTLYEHCQHLAYGSE